MKLEDTLTASLLDKLKLYGTSIKDAQDIKSLERKQENI